MRLYCLEHPIVLQRHLAASRRIYVLVEDLSGDNHWLTIEGDDEAILPQRPPISSPKKLLFSEQENLFVFDGEQFRETLPSPAPFALFGVHSCDLTAIAYQDKFFADDPYYQARRSQALLVGIDCTTPCENGFCYAVGAGPGVNTANADLILHRRKDGNWLLIASSEKGEQALQGADLKAATDAELRDREDQLARCEQLFGDSQYLKDGIAAINGGLIADSFWEEIGIQCLSCSGCTSLCPTCSCYATRDLDEPQGGIRQQRFWDSCLYEGFQREASQHNPSGAAGERVKRFWRHKFGEKFAEQYGRYGCVGCGRCEETCPGMIGVHTVMKRIQHHVQSDTGGH